MKKEDEKYLFKLYRTDNGALSNFNDNLLPLYIDNMDDSTYPHKINHASADYSKGIFNPSEQPNTVWDKGKEYENMSKHVGFSTYGLLNPEYSLFTDRMQVPGVAHKVQGLLDNKESEAIANETIDRYKGVLKDSSMLKKYYNKENNDYDYLTNIQDSKTKLNILRKLTKLDSDMYTINPKYFNFQSDSNYDDLVRILYALNNKKIKDDNINVLLVGAPESAIINNRDVLRNKYTAQRDSPHEIVSTYIVPRRKYSNAVFNDIAKAYNNFRVNKGASGEDAFYDAFKLEPSSVPSDENVKFILQDMSNSLPIRLDKFADAVSGVGVC